MRGRFYTLLFLAVFTPFFAAVYPELARGATCPTLSLGSTGASVTAVQKVLYGAYQGFPTPTGYFGSITAAAVKQWQGEHNIEALGIVGPKTAAAMRLTLCSTATTKTPATVSTTPPNSSSIAALIQTLLAQVKILQEKLAALIAASSTPVPVATTTVPIVLGATCTPLSSQAQTLACPAGQTGNIMQTRTSSCAGGAAAPAWGSWTTTANSCSSPGGTASCLLDSVTVAHGASKTFFTASTVSSGQTCTGQSRTCTNGTLSGNSSYQYSSCTSSATQSCIFNGQTVAHGASVTAYQTSSVPYGSQCMSESRTCNNGTLSGQYANPSCSVAPPPSISSGYVAPTSKLGFLSELGDPLTGDATYQNLVGLGFSAREYNIFWSGFESGGPVSSLTPLQCPVGTILVPANESERVTKGYHRYRCLQTGTIDHFDRLLKQDARYGLQSVAILWSAPSVYRYSGCTGGPNGGSTLYDGCVPRDDAMDDWEDYVNFLAARYNGGAYGKIYHYIIWNENSNSLWFDYSPVVRNRGVQSQEDINKSVQKYADMLRRAYAAIARHDTGVVLDVSTLQSWTPPPVGTNEVSDFGTKTLLDGLWNILGTSIDWSLAVHPYGEPIELPLTSAYVFSNLSQVADYMAQKLRERGITDTQNHPQAWMIASEQLPFDPNITDGAYRARNMCIAYDYALKTPGLTTVTNSYTSDSRYWYIPGTVLPDFSNISSVPTGQAVMAMSPGVWGKNDTNYCCVNAGVGCLHGTRVSGSGFSGAQSNDVLNGWPVENLIDGRAGTPYSSTAFASSTNDRGTFVAAWFKNAPISMSSITLFARMYNGAPVNFPQKYSIALTSPDNSQWLPVGEFTTQPDGSGTAHITLSQTYSTQGIYIQPITLGADPGGGYYFQLGEIEVR
ncbi:MAG: DUF5722 domain-containing protein [Patescibacteria group bacterium]